MNNTYISEDIKPDDLNTHNLQLRTDCQASKNEEVVVFLTRFPLKRLPVNPLLLSTFRDRI